MTLVCNNGLETCRVTLGAKAFSKDCYKSCLFLFPTLNFIILVYVNDLHQCASIEIEACQLKLNMIVNPWMDNGSKPNMVFVWVI